MCATCGCGKKEVNKDGHFGGVNPYGVGGRDVNKPIPAPKKPAK